MRLFRPIYQWLLITALVLVAASFFTAGQRMDIHFLDTFYVFDPPTLLRAMAFGLFLLWLLYGVNRQFLHSTKLTRIHVIVTLVSLAAVLGTTLWINHIRFGLTPQKQDLWIAYYRWEQVQRIAITLVAAAQVVFLMNLLMGVKRAFRRG